MKTASQLLNPVLQRSREQMITYLINNRQIKMLPKVFYHDYNDRNRTAIVDTLEQPMVGDRVLLRDWSNEFQSECEIIEISHIESHSAQLAHLFLHMKQVGPIEYLLLGTK